MTYNNREMYGCSARGIAVRETKEELEALAEKLKETIYNVKIEPVGEKPLSEKRK
jgi:hypothetical protein